MQKRKTLPASADSDDRRATKLAAVHNSKFQNYILLARFQIALPPAAE